MNPQFKKGILEICVLSYLSERDYYGYEIVEAICKYFIISEGTIYPLLRRLNNDGLVNTYLQESTSGPPRKYYRLTENGRKYFKEQVAEWQNFSEGINRLLRRQADE